MIFLVDEAHNLVERAREMYSAALIKEDILAVNRILKSMERHEKRPEAAYNLRKYEKALSALNRSMLSYKRECDEFEVLEHLDAMEFQLLRVLSAYELVAKDYPVLPERETMLNFNFNARNFSRVLELLDEKYRIYADYTETGDFRIKLQCMDPSNCLKEVFERGRSAILFSATLLPVRYYKEQLAGGLQDPAVYADSSFSPEQRKVLIARDVTSKYTRRGPEEYRKIASYIEQFVSAKEGNYLVFFPSYQFMDQIVNRLNLSPSQTLLVQSPDMRESDKENFLAAFDSPRDKTLVGCCVLGGIFSEGIDLKEEQLIGAVIVGTCLPQVWVELQVLK